MLDSCARVVDSGSGKGDDCGSGEGDDCGSGEGDDCGSGEGDDCGSGEGVGSGSAGGIDSASMGSPRAVVAPRSVRVAMASLTAPSRFKEPAPCSSMLKLGTCW